MAIYQKLIPFDNVLAKLSVQPLIINDLSMFTEEDRAKVRDTIATRFESDTFSTVPECMCGETVGVDSLGDICHECGTEVKHSINENADPICWFRAPGPSKKEEGVLSLVNPVVWIMLRARFTKSGFDLISWLTDTSYRSKKELPAFVDKIKARGITRGYNNFIRNFDEIFGFLIEMRDFKKKNKDKEDELRVLIETCRDQIFCKYLPLPNKSILILQMTNSGIYADTSISLAIDAIEGVAGLDVDEINMPLRLKENRTSRTLSKLQDFYIRYLKNIYEQKQGYFRKHGGATRSHFCVRAVVSSLTDGSWHDELHASWSDGLSLFRHHIVGKLLRRGYRHNDAVSLVIGHINRYNPILDEILKELVYESGGGIPCTEHRPPTLKQGSLKLKYITKFKTNPNDKTWNSSDHTVKSSNTDFDGDCHHFGLIGDHFLLSLLTPFSCRHTIMQTREVREISENLSIPKPVLANIAEILDTVEDASPYEMDEMVRSFT